MTSSNVRFGVVVSSSFRMLSLLISLSSSCASAPVAVSCSSAESVSLTDFTIIDFLLDSGFASEMDVNGLRDKCSFSEKFVMLWELRK